MGDKPGEPSQSAEPGDYRADIIIHYDRYRSIYHATKTKELTFGYSLLPIEVHLPSYTKHKASSLFKMGVGS
jgi:hypothetical protein